MISFPLIPPASPTTSDLKSAANNIVGENVSPFTGSQQIFENQGEWWEGQLALPPLYTRANAEPWLAFLAALRGKSGSFLLGDPNAAVPQGSAARSNVNLLLWTEDWTNAAWNKSNITVTVNQADPFGGTSATKLAATAAVATTLNQLVAGKGVAGGMVYSIYVKQGTGATVANGFVFRNNTTATNLIVCSINYGTGAMTYTTGSGPANAANIGSGWWRISIPVSSGISNGDDVAVYAGFPGNTQAIGDFFTAYGPQLEAGTTASAYIGETSGTIAMNGTTQGPKIISLKGLAPSSVAFKAGDYIEIGYGLNATRITITGGTSTSRYLFDSGLGTSGLNYTISVRIRNLGAKTVRVHSNAFGFLDVLSGVDTPISMSGFGNGALDVAILFASLVVADPLDFVVWAPRIQHTGLDENLIPSTGLTFATGWGVTSGSSAALVQGYNRRLYKVLSDSTSDAKGNCGVEIFPRWRNGDAVADGDPVNVFSPRGMFRLADNLRSWQLDNALLYQGISLNIKEAF